MDGWHVDDGSSGSSSSTAGSLPKSLLGRAYGVSFGSADHSSCTNSAIAFKEEEEEEDCYLQQQLCQAYMDLDMDHLFSEEFVVRDSQSAELFPAAEQWQPSPSTSSSPPRRSLSTSCSPDNSTSLHPNNNTSSDPSTLMIPSAQQATRPTSAFAAQPPHQTSRPAYDKRREARFPASASEDMAITSAMLAIFSSSSSSTPTPAASSNNKQWFQPSRTDDQASCRLDQRFRSGFRPYSSSALAPVCEPKKKNKSCSSQKMIKNSICILRRIDLMRDVGSGTAAAKGGSLPSNNQLHHVMSERKRREKLNGNFHTLRMLLPPGSKKDKASVLHKTKDYLKTLKVQILELEKKNQMLEKQLSPDLDEDDDNDDDDGGGSVGRVRVRIMTEAFQNVRGVERLSLKIKVAAGRCDLIELALCVLECLKRMGVLSLLSMDAKNCTSHRSLDPFTWIKFQFEIKASEWDEVAFKEAVAGAVNVMTVEEIHDNPLVGVGVPY